MFLFAYKTSFFFDLIFFEVFLVISFFEKDWSCLSCHLNKRNLWWRPCSPNLYAASKRKFSPHVPFFLHLTDPPIFYIISLFTFKSEWNAFLCVTLFLSFLTLWPWLTTRVIARVRLTYGRDVDNVLSFADCLVSPSLPLAMMCCVLLLVLLLQWASGTGLCAPRMMVVQSDLGTMIWFSNGPPVACHTQHIIFSPCQARTFPCLISCFVALLQSEISCGSGSRWLPKLVRYQDHVATLDWLPHHLMDFRGRF